MIRVEIKPRQDDLFDIWVGDEGDHFVNSHQGYENVEDAVRIARRLWPPIELPDLGEVAHAPKVDTERAAVTGVVDVPREHVDAVLELLRLHTEPVIMRVTYRNGRSHTERLR